MRQILSAGLLALVVPTLAHAGALDVHTLVVPDPRDGDFSREAAVEVGNLLLSSGRYVLVEPSVLPKRKGEDAAQAYLRCGSDPACWSEIGRAASADLVVLVERASDTEIGLRLVVTYGMDMRQAVARRHPGSAPEPEVMDRLFFAPGGIVVRNAPEGTVLDVDGHGGMNISGRAELRPIAAGKHTLDVAADGHAPQFLSVLVLAGQDTELTLQLVDLSQPRHRLQRWTTWAALGLTAAGVAALAVGARGRGHAIEP